MGPTRDLGAVEIGRRENAAAARVPVKGRAPRSAPVKAKRALAGRTLASLIVLFVVPRFGPLAAVAESVTRWVWLRRSSARNPHPPWASTTLRQGSGRLGLFFA